MATTPRFNVNFSLLFVRVKLYFLLAGPAYLLNLHNKISSSENPEQNNTLITSVCCGGCGCGWSFYYVSLLVGSFSASVSSFVNRAFQWFQAPVYCEGCVVSRCVDGNHLG